MIYGKEKITFLLIGCLPLGGCNTKNAIFKSACEETIKKGKEKFSYLDNSSYNNVVNVLLNEENGMYLKVFYMAVDKGNKKVGSQTTPTYIVIHNTANSALSLMKLDI